MNEEQIKKLIREEIGVFSKRKTGDTPTDKLQLANKNFVDKRLYSGTITTAGAAGTPFPKGWTVSKLGTGDYQVTHTLGTANYVLMLASPAFTVTQFSKTSTTFEVNALTAAGAGSNSTVDFIVATY